MSIKKESEMEEITIRLNNVPDTYYGFVAGVLSYVRKKESRLKAVEKYMNDNPSALTSDILEFISSQEDFFEEAAFTCAEVS